MRLHVYVYLRTKFQISNRFSSLVLITLQEHFPQSIQFIQKIVYSKTSIQQDVFGKKMFCVKCSSRSFNISNLVFGCIDVLKKSLKIHRKTPVLECILIKMQASNLQSETLIKKRDTSTGVLQ